MQWAFNCHGTRTPSACPSGAVSVGSRTARPRRRCETDRHPLPSSKLVAIVASVNRRENSQHSTSVGVMVSFALCDGIGSRPDAMKQRLNSVQLALARAPKDRRGLLKVASARRRRRAKWLQQSTSESTCGGRRGAEPAIGAGVL